MSIENIFKALEIVDSLSADDFDKFKKHLEVIDSKFKKRESDCSSKDIPEYNPQPLRSEVNPLAKPPYVPAPPILVWKECTCNNFWNIVCNCGGGRWVNKEAQDD